MPHVSWVEDCKVLEYDDVAISAAIGMSWGALRNLVASFRYFAGWCATLALLVDTLLPAHENETLRAFGVTLVPVGKTWPFLQTEPSLPEAALQRLIPRHVRGLIPDVSVPDLRLVTLRYLLAEAWLRGRGASQRRGSKPGLLLLVDSADIIFQADPFVAARHLLGSGETWLFEENPLRIIAECPFNGLHAKAFGPAFGDPAKGATVVNSGVVIGPRDGVFSLVDAIRKVVLAFPDEELNDQAILNYLTREPRARSLLPDGVKVMPHSTGLVRNVGPELFPMWRSYAPHDVKLGHDTEGWIVVLGADGAAAPILHQYNRNDMLRDTLKERWMYMEGINAGEIRRHCLVTGLCSTVWELEKKLNERIKVAHQCHLRFCGQLMGACQASWKRRKAALLAASGAFFRVERDLVGKFQLCRSLGQTVGLVASFDAVGWAQQLLDEEPEQQFELLDLKRVIAFYLYADVTVELSLGAASPERRLSPPLKGFGWPAPARFLCLDEACGELAATDERALVAWEASWRTQLEGKQFGDVVHRVFEHVTGPPDPEYRFVRELHLPAGRQPPSGANASAVAASLRLRRLPGD